MPSLNAQCILPQQAFLKVRAQKKKEVFALKEKRRVGCGPYAVFYFECFETLWWQTQEMLRIEGGGEDQLQDELEAYAPLVPQGSDWVATLMFEIPDTGKRRTLLMRLGHVEETVTLAFADHTVQALPTDDTQRTTDDGKTSAVHFLRFSFTPQQKALLLANPNMDIVLSINHAAYKAEAHLSQETRSALLSDFNHI